jgi:protein-disulfide isomerase
MSRRALLAGFVAGLVGLRPAPAAAAERATAALAAKPGALPDMALGSAKAPITIVEYSSMTCPHCAAFSENVFPMLQSKYIETGKVRFVSRAFTLDVAAASATMLARCVANSDAPKYFDATTMLFKRQGELVERPRDTLKSIAGHFGMSADAVEACEQDDALLQKIKTDQQFAVDQLKVDATPTFFVNGEKLKGSMSFEELDKILAALLKRRCVQPSCRCPRSRSSVAAA